MTEKEMRLTPSEYFVLQLVRQFPDKGTTSLASYVTLSERTVGTILRKLEGKRIITRSKGTTNGKNYYNRDMPETLWRI